MADYAGHPSPGSDFAGKVALVTGASRGIGAALCAMLSARGVNLACASRSTSDRPNYRLVGTLDDVVAAARNSGVDAIAVPADLTQLTDVEAMVDAALGHFGRLDFLINNAGMTLTSSLESPISRYEKVMAANLSAPLAALQRALPALRATQGRVLNVSSTAALNVYPQTMAYGIAKVGLERMTVDAAWQLQDDQVAVNCFRIDVPVASEGFKANVPNGSFEDWEPPEVPAEGMVWLLSQPNHFTGRLTSLTGLRAAEGIMASRTPRGTKPLPGAVTDWTVGIPDTSTQLGVAGN